MLVREATPEDIRALATVEVHSRGAAYAHFMPVHYVKELTVEDATTIWRERLSGASSMKTMVLESEDQIAGFVRFGRGQAPLPAPNAGELELLFVAPDHWRHGLGSTLLEEAERGLQAMGFASGFLAVFEANQRARGFYEARGWIHDGQRWTVQRGGANLVEMRYRKPLTGLPQTRRFLDTSSSNENFAVLGCPVPPVPSVPS